MNGENALKACPMDGARADVLTVSHPYVRFWVKCSGCGLTSPRRSTREAAERFWNTRSPVCEDARAEAFEEAARVAEAEFRHRTQQYQKPADKDAMVAFSIAKSIRALARTPPREDARGELVEALKVIASGDEPRPVAEKWRADGQPSKSDKCAHERCMYEDCGQCVAEYAAAALANALPSPPPAAK